MSVKQVGRGFRNAQVQKIRQVTRTLGCGRTIELRRHDEVVFVQAFDLLGL